VTAIPSGWTEATLGEIARWGSGGTPRAGERSFYGGDIPWAVIGDLNDGVVHTTAQSITTLGLARSSAKLVPGGAVLIAMYGSIGKLGIAGRDMATNQAIAAAVVNKAVIDRRFLFYYLLSQREQLGRAGKGATQQNIGQGVLKAWPIALPRLDEQRRIVDLLEDHLSRLDAASGELNSVRARLAGLLRAARHSASTGGVRETVPLASLVSRIEAGRSFGSAASAAGDGEWGIVKVSAMTWGAFNETENKVVLDPSRVDERFEIRPGDLLVSRANTSAYVGATVLVGSCRPRLLLSDKSLRLVPHEGVDPRYLRAVLQAPAARSQMSDLATGTKDSMRNISQAALLSIQLPKATPVQQAEVVRKVAIVEEQVGRLRVEVERAQARHMGLRRSLLDAAFAGKL
jgi:type I restriction enzyme S subunit